MPEKKSITKLNALAAGISTIALIGCQNAVGAESSVDLGISAEASYDDNRYLSTTNKRSLYLYRVTPTASFIVEDEGSQTIFTATGTYSKSSDEAVEADRFTYGGNVQGNYQYEYSTLSLGAGYDHQSVFDTEFEDTGRFLNNATRDRAHASFGYANDLSETITFRLSDNFQLIDYSTMNFNNFWSNNAGAGVDIAIDERTSLVQDFGYLHFEPQAGLAASYDSFSYLAGISHQLTEDTVITITGGATYLEDTFRWSAVAEITHQLENNQFSLRAAREITPSGLGGLRQTESIAVGTTYNYSEGTNMGVEASWRRSKGLNNLLSLNDEFIGLSPWVSFEVIEDLQVRFSYRLRRQRIGLSNDWGISNSFFISLQY